jgi:hypothetical protein
MSAAALVLLLVDQHKSAMPDSWVWKVTQENEMAASMGCQVAGGAAPLLVGRSCPVARCAEPDALVWLLRRWFLPAARRLVCCTGPDTPRSSCKSRTSAASCGHCADRVRTRCASHHPAGHHKPAGGGESGVEYFCITSTLRVPSILLAVL